MQKRYVLFLIPFILYIGLLSVMPQMEPDEARYSLIPSAMNHTGDYVTPHIKNTVYLEKPPLAYWVTAISFKIFGENDFAARLFAGLSAWGCILLTFFIGNHFRDEKTGLYAAAILTVSIFPFIMGRLNILDMPLTFLLCLSIWFGYLSLIRQNKRYLYYLFYFACALAFLVKGIVGAIFPFAILFLWLIWSGRWRQILRLVSPVGILIFTIVVSPWLILAQKANADFLWFFFVREHFLRFTTQMHGKTEPFYFFLPIIIGGTIPWSVYLIKAWNVEKIKEWLFRKDENKLLIVWFGFVFLFYTLSSSKLPTYIAPVFLPLALFAGAIICKYEEELSPVTGGRKIFYRIAVIFQSLLIIIALLLPPILKPHSDAEKGLVVMISQNWWLCSLLPMFVAILMTFIPDLVTARLRRGWFVSIYMLCALFLAGMLFPLNDFLAPYRSARVAKEAIARHVPPNQFLYQYRVNFYGIDFYNKIRTPIVDDFGELGDGILKLSPEEINKYFLMTKDFFALIAEKKDVYCITQHSERLKEIKGKFPLSEILWENGAFYLLRIRVYE